MFLFYVRHGDPCYDPDSLTPLGKRQAEALAKRLALYGLDKIYTSTSTRAMETAQPTCEVLQMEPTVLDWTNEKYAYENLFAPTNGESDREYDWVWRVHKYREIFNMEEVRKLDREWYNHPLFKDTTYKEGILRIQKETNAFMESLGYRHVPEKNGYIAERPNDNRIALFAHQGFGLAFLSCLLDIPYPQFSTHFDMGHTGMTVIRFDNREGFVAPVVMQLSNDSHLFREGLPTYYEKQYRF